MTRYEFLSRNFLFQSRKMAVLLIGLAAATNAWADESRANRSGKTAYGAAELIGLTFMPVQGLRAGYHLSEDLAVEAGFARGSAEIGDWKYEKNIVAAKAKYFFGNSFYVDAGLGYEMWNIDYAVLNSSGTGTTDLSGKVNNLGLEFHIGNQWNWDNFMLGCDWLGGFAALSSSKSFGSAGGLSASDKESEESSIASNAEGSSGHFVRLYMGYAF